MSSELEVRGRVLTILSKMLPQPPQYAPGADIFEDFGLDSLDQIEFLFNLEAAFGVKIEDDVFEERGLRKFDNLVAHLMTQPGKS